MDGRDVGSCAVMSGLNEIDGDLGWGRHIGLLRRRIHDTRTTQHVLLSLGGGRNFGILFYGSCLEGTGTG